MAARSPRAVLLVPYRPRAERRNRNQAATGGSEAAARGMCGRFGPGVRGAGIQRLSPRLANCKCVADQAAAPQLKPSKVRMSGFLTPFTVLEARQHISERMSHVTSVLSLVACRESGVNPNAFQSQAHKHCIRLCLTVDLQAVRNLRHSWASHSFADR